MAETLSFTQTAQRLYTTQSALSKHVSALEQELGTQLFMRNQHGVHLTKAGRVFIEYAQEVIRKYDEGLVVLNRLKSGIDRTLNVGYLVGACGRYLPDASKEFIDQHPNTDLQFHTMEIDGIVEGLDSGLIDMGITTEFVKFPTNRYATMPLYEDHISVIVPPQHRLADRESVSVSDLVGETILLANPSFMTKEAPLISNVLAPIVDKVTIKETVNDMLSLFVLMETGRYTTVLFDHIRNYNDFNERFKFIPLAECKQDFSVVAVWRQSAETDAIVEMASILKEKIVLRSALTS